jgi:hypothetical protein
MKEHIQRELTNALTKIARKFHNYDCLRGLIADRVAKAISSSSDNAIKAIEFAIGIDDHYDRLEFLTSWQHGDTSAWPEFKP